MKRILSFLSLLLPLLMTAQSLDGQWVYHPAYLMTAAKDLIDTEQNVYALANGSVIRLNKTSLEVEAMSAASGLSDVSVKNIYYNYDKQYLLIVYANGNMDFLYEDGRLVNVSDLKDVVMNTTKAVNDVTFAGDQVLVATSFGFVVVDDNTHHVVEQRLYNQALTSVAKVGNRWLVAYNGAIYASNGQRESINDFTATGLTPAAAQIRPMDDNNFFVLATGAFSRCAFDTEDGFSCTDTAIVAALPNNLQLTKEGWLANFRTNKYYYIIKPSGTTFTATKTTSAANTLYSRCPTGDGTWWLIDANGIHKNKVTTYYKPAGMYMRESATLFHALYNTWDGKTYITTPDQNWVIGNVGNRVHIFTHDPTTGWTDATPTEIRSWSNVTNTKRIARITFIPGQPGSYFVVNRDGSVYRVINGLLKGKFTNNTVAGPLQYDNTRLDQPGLLIDADGNLWMLAANNSRGPAMLMLPQDKVLADTVLASDWIKFDASPFSFPSFQRQSFVEGTGKVKVYCSGDYMNALNIFRLKEGTTDQLDYKVTTSFIDQNGNGIDWYQNYVRTLAVDSTGNVWVGGTRNRLFYFNPEDAFSDNFRVTSPDAPDGEMTPYEMEVTCIAVDSQNRKWIGTRSAGVFVINADGSQVLKHFDTDNSDLPSSLIYSLAVSPTSAFVVTDKGVVEYSMADIPQATDYTAVTAAPSFVQHDYMGVVSIGMVEPGACVRITDRDGNLVREFTATSNMVEWDLTADDGVERVPTGVYNVFAGHSAEQLPASPQVRVRVVK